MLGHRQTNYGIQFVYFGKGRIICGRKRIDCWLKALKIDHADRDQNWQLQGNIEQLSQPGGSSYGHCGYHGRIGHGKCCIGLEEQQEKKKLVIYW
jgi:hypothetical protein